MKPSKPVQIARQVKTDNEGPEGLGVTTTVNMSRNSQVICKDLG